MAPSASCPGPLFFLASCSSFLLHLLSLLPCLCFLLLLLYQFLATVSLFNFFLQRLATASFSRFLFRIGVSENLRKIFEEICQSNFAFAAVKLFLS